MKNEASEEFWSSFCHSGSSMQQSCTCGRLHFCSSPTGHWSWEEGELESLLEKSAKNPDRYVDVGAYDAISWIDFGAGPVVYGCPCATAIKYETFVSNFRDEILEYYKKKLKLLTDEQKRLEEQLKNASVS